MRPIDVLYRSAERNRPAVAVECGDERVTYGELVAEVDALAAAFQSLDPAPGSRVGICAANTREHLTALLATYAAGKVWVPLSPRVGEAEREAMVRATGPSIVVTDDRVGGDSVRGLIQRFVARGPKPVERAPGDVQIIKWSGGSTGAPKGVLQSVRCLQAQIATIDRHFGFGPADVNLVAAPMTHGASCFILPTLAVGGRLVLLRHATAPAMLDAFERGVTMTYVPPTMVYNMLAEPGISERRFPALRHLVYSAAPMPPDRIAEARRVFGRVLETAYGQVEAPQVVTVMRAAEFEDERNHGSVGRPTFMTEIRVVNADGRALAVGEVGEVCVRGDLVMTGYLDQPELTAATLADGWLRTGDLGMLDERGYLFLKGRSREVINTGGFKVYPAEVESALARHPAVRECCVFGVDDPKWGEAIHAAVVTGEKVTESELIAFVKRELDSVKAPKAVHFLEALPRNAAGKVVRGAVRDLVRDGRV